MRIHEAAVFRHCANAIGVAVSCKTRMTVLAHHRFLQHAHVRLDGFGINPGKQRINFLPDRDKIDSMFSKYLRQNPASRTVHGIHRELEFRLRNQIQISKFADRANISRLQINFFDAGLFPFRRSCPAALPARLLS